MNKFTQYIPSFCEGFEPVVIEFESWKDLSESEFFKKISKDEGHIRFSIGNDDNLFLIMNEYRDHNGSIGAWVVGFASEDIPELPKWVKGRTEE